MVRRAMASVRVTSGTRRTAVKPGVNITRPRLVLWPRNAVGPWHANHPAKDQRHGPVHLPNNTEEPMEMDPPPDEEQPMDLDPPAEEEKCMEVDPPLSGQARSFPGMSLVSTRRAQQVHCRSARTAPYTQHSLRAHHFLGQNHHSGRFVGSPARWCRNK